jgi:hypothetical protein
MQRSAVSTVMLLAPAHPSFPTEHPGTDDGSASSIVCQHPSAKTMPAVSEAETATEPCASPRMSRSCTGPLQIIISPPKPGTMPQLNPFWRGQGHGFRPSWLPVFLIATPCGNKGRQCRHRSPANRSIARTKLAVILRMSSSSLPQLPAHGSEMSARAENSLAQGQAGVATRSHHSRQV